jgi:hypothetical protein
MCRITESGDQCLKDWGRWASRDSTVRRLGYPGCSAEQMAGHVSGGDFEENKIAELVDRLIMALLEERYRLVAKFFYVDRLPRGMVAIRATHAAASQGMLEVGTISERMVKDDLMVIRTMVGSVVLWVN